MQALGVRSATSNSPSKVKHTLANINQLSLRVSEYTGMEPIHHPKPFPSTRFKQRCSEKEDKRSQPAFADQETKAIGRPRFLWNRFPVRYSDNSRYMPS